jgi:hypothetical protein
VRRKTLLDKAKGPPIPDNVTIDEIKDIECDSLLRSVSYCEYRIAEININVQKAIKEGARLDPKER